MSASKPNSPSHHESEHPVAPTPAQAGGQVIEVITLEDDQDKISMDSDNNPTAGIPVAMEELPKTHFTPTVYSGISVALEDIPVTDFQPAIFNVKITRIGNGPRNYAELSPEHKEGLMKVLMDCAVRAEGRKVVFDASFKDS